jgi:hypothetical protein
MRNEVNYTVQSSQKRIRPGWVSAIAIWHFGWFAILLLFICLMYSGAVHLRPGPRARLDAAFAHIPIATYPIGLTNLVGSGFLFYLRKAAFYVFCAGLVVRGIDVTLHFVTEGWGHGLTSVWQIASLIAGTIFCVYARHLIVRGILI